MVHPNTKEAPFEYSDSIVVGPYLGGGPSLGLAIISLLVLVVMGALAGLLFFRAFGQAAARDEDQAGGGNEEDGDQPGSLGEETRRSVWFFLGVGAAMTAMLIDVAAVVTAFSGDNQFENNASSVAFLAFMLAVIAYFLGARMIAAGAVVFTVVALAVAAAIMQWL